MLSLYAKSGDDQLAPMLWRQMTQDTWNKKSSHVLRFAVCEAWENGDVNNLWERGSHLAEVFLIEKSSN